MGVESAAFTATTMFAGWLGNDALAAYQDAINVNAFVFMLALGLQTATSVRVAIAVGQNDQPGLRAAGWVGAGLNIGLLAAVGVVIWFGRDTIATVFTDNPAVHLPLVSALSLVAVICIADGLQAVLMGATRGIADTVIPTVLQGISFWVIMVPLTYYLSIATGLGVNGLYPGHRHQRCRCQSVSRCSLLDADATPHPAGVTRPHVSSANGLLTVRYLRAYGHLRRSWSGARPFRPCHLVILLVLGAIPTGTGQRSLAANVR